MTKGARRFIRSNVKELASFAEETLHDQARDAETRERRKEKQLKTEPIAGNSKRKPGPWRVLEVCTWLCMVMSKAFDMGWDAHQPIALPDFDLLKPAGRGLAREYLQEVDPDLLILSFPCTEWSPLQYADPDQAVA